MNSLPKEVVIHDPFVYRRPRGFIAVYGPEAAVYLNRMLSNEIESLGAGVFCEAMLLTPKARVVALFIVYCRDENSFLLITDEGLDDIAATALLRAKLNADVQIEIETQTSYVVCGVEPTWATGIVVANSEFGQGHEVVGEDPPSELVEISEEEAECRRIEAGMPRFGWEIDDRVLPAEAGLVDRAVSFEKGCYPGQEPIARLQYRGHTNRGLRILSLQSNSSPPLDTEVLYEGKVVGRITSAAVRANDVVALAYIRNEIKLDAVLEVDGALASIIGLGRP